MHMGGKSRNVGMKTVVCIASHQRHHPLTIGLKALPADWHAVVVITEGEDPDPIRECRPNVHVFHHENQPLGRKWQYAVDRARELQPDLLVIQGSDDVLEVDTKDLYRTMETYQAVGVRRFTAFDGKRYYQCQYRHHVQQPIGSGRVYRRDILDQMDWLLFHPHRKRGLDDQGWYSANLKGACMLQANNVPGIQVIAMKGPWDCLNSLDRYLTSTNLICTPIPLHNVRHRVHHQF
jgi:hypothetical protein